MSNHHRYAKILVADDDKGMLKALSLRLWDQGYEMVTATDSDQVLRLVQTAKPNLLLLDVNMPSGDGFSIHEQIKNMPDFCSLPVIYLTGDKSARLDTLAQQVGAVALFHKPFSIKALIETIDSALEAHAA